MDIDSIIKDVTEEICVHTDMKPAPKDGDNRESASPLARYIDHTILNADANVTDVQRVCDEAKRYYFASVCVNSSYAKFVSDCLTGADVRTCCVVGFPLGAMESYAKTEEASRAAALGAEEIDMVINIGAVKSGDWRLVYSDIERIVNAVRGRAIVKTIIEACLLTDEEKVKACTAAKMAGAHFVKTSTGFSKGGATPEDVHLMRRTVGPDMGVKASGGIRSYEDAVRMIDAGATRLGTSSGVEIISGGGKRL